VAFVLYSFVGAIVVGIFLYYATRPIYRWIDQWTEHPDLSATVTLLTVGLPILPHPRVCHIRWDPRD